MPQNWWCLEIVNELRMHTLNREWVEITMQIARGLSTNFVSQDLSILRPSLLPLQRLHPTFLDSSLFDVDATRPPSWELRIEILLTAFPPLHPPFPAVTSSLVLSSAQENSTMTLRPFLILQIRRRQYLPSWMSFSKNTKIFQFKDILPSKSPQ